MYNILIVDDEPLIRSLISKYANFEGHTSGEAENGLQAVGMVKDGNYDIVIMDIMMPELDGFSASREIRKFSDIPIIMLSARGEEYDRINGFELGIDDYVVKPFSPKELMLRIDAVMKRYKKSAIPSDDDEHRLISYNGGGLIIDMSARIVRIDGINADMTPKEYDLLFYLIANKGLALTREKLITEVWGYDYFGDDRTLDTHIKLLRKSLGPYSDHIVTLRGVGYRFDE